MPSKKKPAKKAAAKKVVEQAVKSTPAKAVKKPAAKKPAAKKAVKTAPAKKKTPARRAPTKVPAPLPEGVTLATLTTVQISNVAPVNLGVNDVSGTPMVFYGTTLVDTEIDDIFEYTTAVTSVDWIVTNNASYTVDVTFGTGSAIPLANRESTTYPMTMPAGGSCNSTNLFVQVEGQMKHDPVIKIKRKDSNGRIPNC